MQLMAFTRGSQNQAPPRYLVGGDSMRCEIDDIGSIADRVVDEEPRIEDHFAAAGIASEAR